MGQHDLSYRLFFTHRRMIQDLLREIVGERWVERIDLDSGQLANPDFVSEWHEKRESDVIWKFRRKDREEPAYVYILLEFQSRPDPSMPVRLMSYEGLLYQNLMASQPAAGWKNLPLLIAVVVYNGWEPWNVATDLGSLIEDLDPSAEIYRPYFRYRLIDERAYPRERLAEMSSPVAQLFRIEKTLDTSELLDSFHRLRQNLSPAEASLRKAFETWTRTVVIPRFGVLENQIPADLNLEELETMLAENIDRWNIEALAKARRESRQEAEAQMLLRQLRLKFGPLDTKTEERVRSTDADRLLEWADRVLTAERLADIFQE
jgi:predicted transposase/invertase (TIGR01784 family)